MILVRFIIFNMTHYSDIQWSVSFWHVHTISQFLLKWNRIAFPFFIKSFIAISVVCCTWLMVLNENRPVTACGQVRGMSLYIIVPRCNDLWEGDIICYYTSWRVVSHLSPKNSSDMSDVTDGFRIACYELGAIEPVYTGFYLISKRLGKCIGIWSTFQCISILEDIHEYDISM